MSSEDQSEGASGDLTALPSTMEIFDKFKPVLGSVKRSESEESFHLLLDDDDTENQLNGGDKDIVDEETEDDILNKFETPDVGPQVEESILNDDEGQSSTEIKLNAVISINSHDDSYTNKSKGEFKSLYEDEVEPDAALEQSKGPGNVDADNVFENSMEMDQESIASVESLIIKLEVEDYVENEVPMDINSCDIKVPEGNFETETNAESETSSQITQKRKRVELSDDDMEVCSHVPAKLIELEEPVKEQQKVDEANKFPCQSEGQNMQVGTIGSIDKPEGAANESALDKINVEAAQECKELNNDEIVLESDKNDKPVSEAEIIEITVQLEDNNADEKFVDLAGRKPSNKPLPGNESSILKVLEENHEEQETKEEPDITSDKSNDRTEDESDLLDVTMIRETEEDDACAMADAMTDIETGNNEKSDEERSDRMDTEQETSDYDKEFGDNLGSDEMGSDKNDMGSDEMDEDSQTATEDENYSSSQSQQPYKLVKSNDCSNIAKNNSIEVPAKSDEKVDTDDGTVVDAGTVTSNDEAGDGMVVDAATDTANDEDRLVEPEVICKEKEEVFDTSDKTVLVDNKKTDKLSNKPQEGNKAAKEIIETTVSEKIVKETPKNVSDSTTSLNKRSCSPTEIDVALVPKKAKMIPVEPKPVPPINDKLADKLKVLPDFGKFMQCKKLTAQLTRSDLEQLCIQKICEALMLKSSDGELHQKIKTLEDTIGTLRRDISQLSKQCKDLDIVNKKLLNEIRNPSGPMRPLVPLRITRSVGLQVRRMDSEPRLNKTPVTSVTPISQKQPESLINRKPATPTRTTTSSGVSTQSSSAVSQVSQNIRQKSFPSTTVPTSNSQLGQALQTQQKGASPAAIPKSTTTPARNPAEATARAGGVVVDLTDEGDRAQQAKSPANIKTKIVSRSYSQGSMRSKGYNTKNKTSAATNKQTAANNKNTAANNKNATPPVAQQASKTAVQKKPVAKTVVGKQPNQSLPQGIRLAQAIQTTSPNGSPQLMYVVPTAANAGGQQKVALVNFQPSMPGQTVSVLPNNKGSPGILPNNKGSPGLLTNNKGSPHLSLKPGATVRPHKHPAPLPTVRVALDPKLKPLLPKPQLSIKRIDTGIILQWKMPYNLDQYESIASYQLYAYQETSAPPITDMWRKVGDVKALALPMACTLTQFAEKNKYFFCVRAVDVHKRIGAFSEPEEILL